MPACRSSKRWPSPCSSARGPDWRSSPDGSRSPSWPGWSYYIAVTPSATSAKSPAAETSRPGIARLAHSGGFWMSAAMARLTDLGFAVVVVLFAVPGAFGKWPDPALTIALILPLVWRRRWPTLVFGLVAIIAFSQWLIGGQPLGGDLALLVAFYTVAAYESARRTVLCAGVLELGIVLAAVRWSSGVSLLWMIVLLSGMAVAAGVLGLNVRTRRAYLDSLRDRAERLERDRDQQSVIATAAERARIAREMHDVVAHHLAVMTALADGARFALAAHPDQAATAMNAVSATGRAALSDKPATGPGRTRRARRAGQRRRAARDLHHSRRRRVPCGAGVTAGRLPHRPGGAHQRAQARWARRACAGGRPDHRTDPERRSRRPRGNAEHSPLRGAAGPRTRTSRYARTGCRL